MAKRYPLKRQQAASRGARALGAALLIWLAPGAAAHVFAQTAAPASVAGRVRDGERGVPGITVALVSAEPTQRFRTAARAKTDAEGRFLIQNAAPGRYQVVPYAPAYVIRGLSDGGFLPGRLLTLLPGDEVKDIDFQVERGGVITGRVTDADGAPVVAEAVFVAPETVGAQQPMRPSFDMRDQMTDDRGVYRLYGLQPGRYRVSVGQVGENTGVVSFGRRRVFQRVFYPGTPEESQARIVEVRAGEEQENVDISLGRPLKTYKASGRFISVETGQPVPNVGFGYVTLDAAGRRVGSFGGGQATNASGEFTTEGLAPGRYAVFTMPGPQEASEFYSEATPFDIGDADVSGIVVRVKRGASVSGFVAIEGVSDRRVLARMLSQVRVFGFVEPAGGRREQIAPAFSSRPPVVGPDGSFRLTGLRPGKLRISASAEGEKGLALTRVELNGANIASTGIEVAEGAQVAGARVVMTYGTSVITGQVSFLNGAPQQGSRIVAQARRAGSTPASGEFGRSAEADARGLFRIEGLPAGEYEVLVHVFGPGGRPARSQPLQASVAEGGEARVAPVIDFNQSPARPPN